MKKSRPFSSLDSPIFVVHKHKASRLHYDFRLEMDGVLKSWAVPKGPSTSGKDKRMAIEVEDHALSYGDFEGRIPKGNYGAGAVMVWDYGRWELQDKSSSATAQLTKGKLKFILHGKKLKGKWVIFKTKIGWLLLKEKDDETRDGYDILEKEPKSALSGRTIEQLESDPSVPELSCEDFG